MTMFYLDACGMDRCVAMVFSFFSGRLWYECFVLSKVKLLSFTSGIELKGKSLRGGLLPSIRRNRGELI